MELFFELHYHEGVCHKKFQSKFTSEATLDQLEEKIHSKFQIDSEDQYLFSVDGNEIDGPSSSSLVQLGLKNLDKIIVKHSFLTHWSTYLDQIGMIRDITTSGMTDWRMEIDLEAMKFRSLLIDTNFFVVHPKFLYKRKQIDKEINFVIYNTKKYTQRAVEKYFNSLFEGHIVELHEKPIELQGLEVNIFLQIGARTLCYRAMQCVATPVTK